MIIYKHYAPLDGKNHIGQRKKFVEHRGNCLVPIVGIAVSTAYTRNQKPIVRTIFHKFDKLINVWFHFLRFAGIDRNGVATSIQPRFNFFHCPKFFASQLFGTPYTIPVHIGAIHKYLVSRQFCDSTCDKFSSIMYFHGTCFFDKSIDHLRQNLS